MANEIKYFFTQNMALMGQVIQAIVILHLLHFHYFLSFLQDKNDYFQYKNKITRNKYFLYEKS